MLAAASKLLDLKKEQILKVIDSWAACLCFHCFKNNNTHTERYTNYKYYIFIGTQIIIIEIIIIEIIIIA